MDPIIGLILAEIVKAALEGEDDRGHPIAGIGRRC